MIAERRRSIALLRQPGLEEQAGKPVQIRLVLVVQRVHLLGDSELRIDAQEFGGLGLRLLCSPERAIGGGQENMRQISIRLAGDGSFPGFDGVLLVTGKELALLEPPQQ